MNEWMNEWMNETFISTNIENVSFKVVDWLAKRRLVKTTLLSFLYEWAVKVQKDTTTPVRDECSLDVSWHYLGAMYS